MEIRVIRGVESFLFEALCLLLITGIFSYLILKDKLSVEIRVIRGDTYRSTLNAPKLPHKPRANRTYRNGVSWRYTRICHGE